MNQEYPQGRKDVVASKLGGETMLFDPKTGKVHILNKTASLIWKMADGRHQLKDMAKNIRRNFSIPQTTSVKSDISNIFGRLKR